MIHSAPRAIWRLFWKEYRVQRAFWIGIAVLTVLLICLARFSVVDPAARMDWQFGFAVVLPTLFAAACGGMLFAVDQEAGTYEFQRSLPVRPAHLLFSKFVFALLSMTALYVIGWLAAVWLSGLPVADALQIRPSLALFARRHFVDAMSIFFPLELFLWSSLFSLLLRRPLAAAIAGAAAASIALTIVFACTKDTATIPLRVVVAAMLASAVIWLALRWLGERHITLAPRRFALRRFALRSAAQRSDQFRTSSWTRVISRLLWEDWRQSRGLLLALGALWIPAAIHFRLFAMGYLGGGGFRGIFDDDVFAIALAMASFPLAGAITFVCDQQRYSYRFLADRGVRPGQIWLSRQLLLWLLAALLVAAFSAVAVTYVLRRATYFKPLDAAFIGSIVKNLVVSIASIALLGLAAGQFCSMLFRNGFLAAFFGLLLSGVLTLWYGLMWLWGVNWFWSVLPIPLALLLATWLRTPHWLAERNTLRAWLPVALALVIPAAAIFTAVPLYRAYEIPAVSPGFSPDEYTQPVSAAEQATCDLYEKAWNLKQDVVLQSSSKQDKKAEVGIPTDSRRRTLTPEQIAWVDDNAKAIAITLQASRQGGSDYLSPWSTRGNRSVSIVSNLAYLVRLSAQRLEEQGNLDAAMERYLATIRISVQLRKCSNDNYSRSERIEQETYDLLPYWAARPKQTPERILAAARELEKLTADLPPDVDAVKREYLRLRRALSGGYAAMIEAYRGGGEEVALLPLTWLWSCLPWERTRALRLLNVLTRRQLAGLADVQAAAERGEAIRRPPYRRQYFSSEDGPYTSQELPYVLHEEVHVPPIKGPLEYEQDDRIRRYTAMVASRRGVRLILLLEAWKLRHGSLPNTLDELVGPDLDRLPIDPYTGVPFRYVREGVGIPLRWHGFAEFDYYYDNKIAAKVPFVWSAGPQVIYNGLEEGQKEPDYYDYRIIDNPWGENPQKRRAQSEYNLWECGWAIPVP